MVAFAHSSSTAFRQGICQRNEHQMPFLRSRTMRLSRLFSIQSDRSIDLFHLFVRMKFGCSHSGPIHSQLHNANSICKHIGEYIDKSCDCCRDIHDNPSANWDFSKSQVTLKPIKYNWDITMVITRMRHKVARWRIATACQAVYGAFLCSLWIGVDASSLPQRYNRKFTIGIFLPQKSRTVRRNDFHSILFKWIRSDGCLLYWKLRQSDHDFIL